MSKVIKHSTEQVSLQIADPVLGLIDEFLNESDLKEISRDSYRRKLISYFRWCLQRSLPPQKRKTVLRYKKYLVDQKRTAYTIGGMLVPLRGFFKWMSSTRPGFVDPTQNIKGAKRIKGFCRDAFTVDQIKEILNAIDRSTLLGKRDYALISILARCGIRSIEACRASVGDIRVVHQKTVLYLQSKGSDTKSDFVVLVESTKSAIFEYLNARGASKPSDPLFGSLSDGNFGERIGPRAIRYIFKKRVRIACKIFEKTLTTHSLRHFFITESVHAGVPLEQVRDSARHASIQSTEIYLHLKSRADGNPERAVSDVLDKSLSQKE